MIIQSGLFTNNTCEAYTENSLGRKESRTFLKQFSSENEYNTNGDTLNVLEANTKESLKVRFWRVRRSLRAWHGEREMFRNLGGLIGSLIYKGRSMQRERRLFVNNGESDHIIVISERESRLQGEGCDRVMQPAKEVVYNFVCLRLKPDKFK